MKVYKKIPLATLSMVIVIFSFHYYLVFNLPKPQFWNRFYCDGSKILRGEVWRLLSSVLPHSGWQHLIEDIIYLVFVGIIAEYIFKWWRMMIVWCMCEICSSISCLVFIGSNYCGIGSSASTHGLLAFVTAWIIFHKDSIFTSIFAGTVLLYLFYLSIYAVYYGVMGWPLTMLPNVGWDHLGGVVMGTVLGIVYHFWCYYSRKRIKNR